MNNDLLQKVLDANAQAHNEGARYHIRAVPYISRKQTREYYWSLIKKSLKNNNKTFRDKNALEIGCGTGTFLNLALKEQAKSFDGIDVSQEMIKIAKSQTKRDNVRFMVDSLESYATNNACKYDIILSSSFLHHLTDLEKGIKLIKQMLKPGGIYIALHEEIKDRKQNSWEILDLELQMLFGYCGNIKFSPLKRMRRFIYYMLGKIKEDFNSADNVNYVDYQMNFDFNLLNSVALKHGEVIPYSYFGFIELLTFNKPLNYHMFVMIND